MLTKQSRQFEQWAEDRERLMAIKAKRAAEKQAEAKMEGAVMLMCLGTVLSLVACYGFLSTNNPDHVIVLVFGFLVFMFGALSSKQ